MIRAARAHCQYPTSRPSTRSATGRSFEIDTELRLWAPHRRPSGFAVAITHPAYCAKTCLSRGAAKSRKARILIGRNRLAVYTRLTGNVAGWNSSSRLVSAPRSRAAWKWYEKAEVIPMLAHAASHAASALPTASRAFTGIATFVLSLTNVQTSGDTNLAR